MFQNIQGKSRPEQQVQSKQYIQLGAKYYTNNLSKKCFTINTPSHLRADCLSISFIPAISLSLVNFSLYSAFVNISATISSIPQYFTSTVPLLTWSRIK